MKHCGVTIQMDPLCQYFHVVLPLVGFMHFTKCKFTIFGLFWSKLGDHLPLRRAVYGVHHVYCYSVSTFKGMLLVFLFAFCIFLFFNRLMSRNF